MRFHLLEEELHRSWLRLLSAELPGAAEKTAWAGRAGPVRLLKTSNVGVFSSLSSCLC